jgi:hypothetical protein
MRGLVVITCMDLKLKIFWLPLNDNCGNMYLFLEINERLAVLKDVKPTKSMVFPPISWGKVSTSTE